MASKVVLKPTDPHTVQYQRAILTGWEPEQSIFGQPCQVCQSQIWGSGFVRLGDNWSPALYRHKDCHSE